MNPSAPRRLYMDNAATSFPKPTGVLEAMVRYATDLGASAGRGAYSEALETGNLLTKCRQRLNRLFNGENPAHFVFTLNCSDSLNLAIKGLFELRVAPELRVASCELREGAGAGDGVRSAMGNGSKEGGDPHTISAASNSQLATHNSQLSPQLATHNSQLSPQLLSNSQLLPHAICTHIDHNSILRPLGAMEDLGLCSVTRIGVSSTGLVDPDDIRRAITSRTRMVAITHASNVTGTVQPIREIGRICRERGVYFIVDAAQSAGHIPIDVQADFIDLLAAPGHKALLGPLGTGFLYIRPGVEKVLRPLREGGTGSASENDRQPEFMPDKYEPGSHNAIGIAGLSEGVKWILERGIESLARHDRELVQTFIEGMEEMGKIEGLTYYGPQGVKDRIGVFSVRIEGIEPYELAAILESSYGILSRPGLHCAPLAHQAIGTAQFGGTTRLSFSPFLTVQDVNYATDALAEIALNVKSQMLNAKC